MSVTIIGYFPDWYFPEDYWQDEYWTVTDLLVYVGDYREIFRGVSAINQSCFLTSEVVKDYSASSAIIKDYLNDSAIRRIIYLSSPLQREVF